MTVTRSVRSNVAWPLDMGLSISSLIARGFMTSRWACEEGPAMTSGSGTSRSHQTGRCASAPALLRNGPVRVYRDFTREDTAGVRTSSSLGEAEHVSTE